MGQVAREMRRFRQSKATAANEALDWSRRIYLTRRCACAVGLQASNLPVGLTYPIRPWTGYHPLVEYLDTWRASLQQIAGPLLVVLAKCDAHWTS
jgi:hypothetical protein